MRKIKITALISFVLATFCANSQLELEKIMSGNNFIGHQPTDIIWSPNSQEFYFRWKHEGEAVAPYYVYHLESKKYRKLRPEETLVLPVDGFESNQKRDAFFFKRGHILYRYNTNSPERIVSKYSNYSVHEIIDQNTLIIQEEDNLFLLDRLTFSFTQLTNFRKGKKSNEISDSTYLMKQQSELFEVIRERQQRREAQQNFNELHTPQSLSPFYLEGKYVSFLSINKNRSHVIFGLDKYPEDSYTHIEEYVTSDGYSRSSNARPKVGSEDPIHEVFVWNLQVDSCFQINFENLSGVRKRPEFFKDYEQEKYLDIADHPKKLVFHSHDFNASGNKFLLEIKSYDNKDRWIVTYDITNNELIELNHQHDESWIGGPGISGWKMESGNLGWISDATIYFQSEESGYSHLYSLNVEDKTSDHGIIQLTDGTFEIHQATLSNDKKKFFIVANKNHPGNREFYTLDIASRKLTPILTSDGNHEISISPDEKWVAYRYSYKNKPWEVYLAPIKESTVPVQLTKSTTDFFDQYAWRSPEVVTYTARDGKEIFARLYEPSEKTLNGPAVIFVHGAGYLQNAHNWWSSYYREYMFHNFLADQGYTVLDIDYRASEGYGRDFRTDIYRHMGGKDLSDQLDGRKFLIEKYGIDSTRIGIYGGSYGGFITLMALLTEPGKFKCGAALRSVTDWAHYNHEYTSNILNTPQEDPVAYRRSSPIYFAHNLSDRLLMLHGIEDDNVQYQDVVRLSQRFIELKKTRWDLIGYPIEPHGFVETSSWLDEYRRIYNLFEEELKP